MTVFNGRLMSMKWHVKPVTQVSVAKVEDTPAREINVTRIINPLRHGQRSRVLFRHGAFLATRMWAKFAKHGKLEKGHQMSISHVTQY